MKNVGNIKTMEKGDNAKYLEDSDATARFDGNMLASLGFDIEALKADFPKNSGNLII